MPKDPHPRDGAAPSRTRVPMLDVLRGVAVMAVFVQHLGDRYRPLVVHSASGLLPEPLAHWLKLALERGHWGVDLFFVLSGFTLGMGFVQEHARGRPRGAAQFFVRRAARILPGFYVALIVHLIANPHLIGTPGLAQALVCHAVLLQGYFSPGHITLIGASWSLSTESHFYLVAPLLSRWLQGPFAGPGVRPRRWQRTALIVVAGCLGVWLVRGVLHDLALRPDSPPNLLELSQRKWALCRVDQFVLGLGAAIAHARLAARVRARLGAGAWVMAVAIGLLGLAVPLDAATWGERGGHPAYALVSIAMTLLVLGGALLPDRTASVVAPLRALGVVSYGFFLYHQLAIRIAQQWVPASLGPWPQLACVAALGIVLGSAAGSASWFLVESPALAWVARRRRATRQSG